MDEKLRFGECYICLEDTPLLSQCLCVERYLCENCMEKLRIYNYKKCTVCHTSYPKRVDQETIDIQFLNEEEEEEDYSCVPCCLRPKIERHKPKYCLFDLLTHICCVYSFMLIISCSVHPVQQCYGWNVVYYFLPAVVLYIVVTGLLATIRG